MIPSGTIQVILDTARIEEVVSDFVALKRRGSNMIGLCPFHNERTPSFSVSPVKGIYKCFGCGKAGNSVNFVMEHEKFTYPEALRYLAKKYNIEVVEEQESEETIAEKSAREGLFVITEFAAKYFAEQLWNTDKGKSIGLSYFRGRGFGDDTITKFQLGYSSDEWDAFTQHALHEGYSAEMLEKSGLSINKENRLYDRYRDRVIFPIHSQSGKVIGFGGRIMTADKNKPKYVNSPESEIYNKSKSLFGIYFAKHAIAANDVCFLVEGYTDVISLHQAGIQNVVSSSGTSLTTDQIRLIKRYTPNITILYDGDPAGIKASFRGIDMILEQGMNVKVVLFPDGEDPDSFAQKHRSAEVQEFITQNAKDFIHFKIDLLLKETGNDPLKKVAILKEFIESISLMPDRLTRLAYVKESATRMQMDEQAILSELNKVIRRKHQQRTGTEVEEEVYTEEEIIQPALQPDSFDPLNTDEQEKEIIRQLLMYGDESININVPDEKGEPVAAAVKVAKLITEDIAHDDITFKNELYQRIFNICRKEIITTPDLDYKKLTNHTDPEISSTVIGLIANKYTFSHNWLEKLQIRLVQEKDALDRLVPNSLLSFKEKRLRQMMRDFANQIKATEDDTERERLQMLYMQMHKLFRLISGSELGRTIV